MVVSFEEPAMSDSLRRSAIRLAATLPVGSQERRALLAAVGGQLDPQTTPMEEYLVGIQTRLMVSYPAIYNALGVERGDVSFRNSVAPNSVGRMIIKSAKAEADIEILVGPNTGHHIVSGEARGIRLKPKKFLFRAESSGMHHGTLGDIVHYISDAIASSAEVVYAVYGQGPRREYKDEAALGRAYKIVGRTSKGSQRVELQDQPRLEGLSGPVWGGRDGNTVEVRYETYELNDLLSR